MAKGFTATLRQIYNLLYDVYTDGEGQITDPQKEHKFQAEYNQVSLTNNKITQEFDSTNADFYNEGSNTLIVTLKKGTTTVAIFTLQPQGNSKDALVDETFDAFNIIDVTGSTSPTFSAIVRS
jgi:hypothetical protein